MQCALAAAAAPSPPKTDRKRAAAAAPVAAAATDFRKTMHCQARRANTFRAFCCLPRPMHANGIAREVQMLLWFFVWNAGLGWTVSDETSNIVRRLFGMTFFLSMSHLSTGNGSSGQ